MIKLLGGLIFIALSFVVLAPGMADEVVYYSADGEILAESEYRQACEKKAEELKALRRIAQQYESRQPTAYKGLKKSNKLQLYAGNEKNRNRKSHRKRLYLSKKKEDADKKTQQEEEEAWLKERERLKRKYEAEIPGLKYSTDPIEDTSSVENPPNAKEPPNDQGPIAVMEKSERDKELDVLLSRKCHHGLVKIYDHASDQIRCVPPSIAQQAAEQDHFIEIIEE